MAKLIPNFNNWKMANGLKFDKDLKRRFLYKFARTGRIQHSAAAVGVTSQTVANHRKSDPEFEEAFQEALAHYRDCIQEAVYKLAVEGIKEPIMGGQFKDEVVAHRTIYATNLLAMEAKRVNPEYRENNSVNVNVNAGVLVVPANMSVEEWEQQQTAAAQKQLSQSDNGTS